MSTVLQDPICDEQRNEVHGLWEDGRISESDVSADKELQATYRSLSRRSLYFYTKAVLGYADITKRTHFEYCNFLQDVTHRKTLDVLPRGCFKTTCGTIAFGSHYVINNPNKTVLIANQAEGNAERMLKEIEQHFDGSNSMINWLFPTFVKPGDRFKPWSSHEMTFPCRDIISGTPSFTSIGVGSKAESQHYNVIINDDLIGEKAMESDTIMMDAITWHDYSISLFADPMRGIERMHGTRWNLSDIYSILLEDPEYRCFIRAAENLLTRELFFPERLSRDFLRSLRDRNFSHYMSQYMNDPSNPEALDFRLEWLNRFQLVPTDDGPACKADGRLYYVKDMDVILLVDPAGSGDVDSRLAENMKRGRARKSNNAVGIVGLHGSGGFFLLDLWVGRGKGENPELQVAEEMYRLAQSWHGYVRRGYVEAYGAQRALITIFNMLCSDSGYLFPMEEIPRGIQKAKKVRIRSAIGATAQNKNLYIRRVQDDFINEYSKFPQMPDKEDTLDMMAWAIMMLRRPYSEVAAKRNQLRNARKKTNRFKVIGRGGY